MIKFLTGWKTLIFNGVMALVLVATQFGLFTGDNVAPTGDQVHGVLDNLDGVIAGILAIGNALLRAGSNTTIFKSTSPAPQPPS